MDPVLPTQVVAHFLSAVEDSTLRRATMAIRNAYPEAFDQSRALFAEAVAHDYIGHRRRAIIENAFGALAAASNGSIRFVLNVTGGANHCEIRYGNVVITESKIDHSKMAIHEARFRATLASRTEPGLFYSLDPLPDDTPLWAAIVHGPGSPYDRTPGFIRVVFPDIDGVHRRMPSIDLYARYPDLRPTPADLPSVAVEAEPTPRFLPGVLPDEEETAQDDE